MNDELQFETFYESTRKPLYAYVYRMAGDPAAAQDIFQESYLRWLNADLSALDDSARKAYLFRIASNLVNDHFRRRKRERRLEDEMTMDQVDMEMPAERTGTAAVVLEQLSRQNRSLLWLAYVEQYDHSQIAEILGLRRGSVKVLLFRAKQKALALLQGQKTKRGSSHE